MFLKLTSDTTNILISFISKNQKPKVSFQAWKQSAAVWAECRHSSFIDDDNSDPDEADSINKAAFVKRLKFASNKAPSSSEYV